MNESLSRLEFCRMLLLEFAPEEEEFLPEYVHGAKIGSIGNSIGPEFGVNDAVVSLGPLVVFIGQKIFDALLSWSGSAAKKAVEGFLVDEGKARLKAWLVAPKKEPIGNILTPKGQTEILAVVSRLVVQAKLSPKEAARVTKQITEIVIAGGE